jgi:2-oxoglutarate/2-oxoacid ferredoxin oxidoreductase subunit alpha
LGERILVTGNEAVGWGAIGAGCLHFFGYPVTPQNEITEWFARELPKRGGCFVQSQSETGSINMLFGATTTGVRAITTTSGPGWGLMQEGISSIANAEVPCVIVNVQRGGPGAGTTRHGQMDYLSVTRGGGQGGYKNITLTPASIQEIYDHTQLAFYLADKYRNFVVLLSDGILGQMIEPLELRTLNFGPLPEKDWAIKGLKWHKDGKRRVVMAMQGLMPTPPHPPYGNYMQLLEALDKKYRLMEKEEVRYDTFYVDDAEIIVVAYGYTARVSKEAIVLARREGIKVGMIRPITAWPFPYQVIREKARKEAKFLVVEDSLGQLLEDVTIGVQGKAEVHLLGALARHDPTDGGMILPERVLEEILALQGA